MKVFVFLFRENYVSVCVLDACSCAVVNQPLFHFDWFQRICTIRQRRLRGNSAQLCWCSGGSESSEPVGNIGVVWRGELPFVYKAWPAFAWPNFVLISSVNLTQPPPLLPLFAVVWPDTVTSGWPSNATSLPRESRRTAGHTSSACGGESIERPVKSSRCIERG